MIFSGDRWHIRLHCSNPRGCGCSVGVRRGKADPELEVIELAKMLGWDADGLCDVCIAKRARKKAPLETAAAA